MTYKQNLINTFITLCLMLVNYTISYFWFQMVLFFITLLYLTIKI